MIRTKVVWGGLAIILAASVLAAAPATRPDPQLTPGATRAVTLNELCTPGTASRARQVSDAVKAEAYARYHVKPSGRWTRSKKGRRVWKSDFEVDHLISLELGGSNDIRNLWPESYLGRLNAHDKDALENQLHRLVCTGYVPLAEAQRAIATDWIAALKKYGGSAGPR